MYYEISGYWKDDKSEFEGYIVREFDDSPSENDRFSDDDIFYYGLSEQEIQTAIRKGDDGVLDFVITSYKNIS